MSDDFQLPEDPLHITNREFVKTLAFHSSVKSSHYLWPIIASLPQGNTADTPCLQASKSEAESVLQSSGWQKKGLQTLMRSISR